MFRLKATPRLKEMFTYMARGMTSREIAYIMDLSQQSLNMYKTKLLQQNRYTSSSKMVCDYYTSRIEYLEEKNKTLQEKLTQVRKEFRDYKNAVARRERKRNS